MLKAVKSKCRTCYWIFFHNEQATTNYIVDSILEPLYRIIEWIAKSAGPIFVFLVTVLTASVVVIYYQYILPWISAHWPLPLAILNWTVGHWLLINIVFHYIMAVRTAPGKPPPRVDNPVSICKSCVAPKPSRTHHCSVCKQCVLKMDHHCPWLNNCVGHYNHRYFYLFCLYMTLGTIFVSVSIYPLFMSFFPGSVFQFIVSLLTPAFSILRAWYSSSKDIDSAPTTAAVVNEAQPITRPVESFIYTDEQLQTRFWVSYEFFLCVGVTIALGSLLAFHTRLIGRAETSIEKHINAKERRRMNELGTTYRNPYHFGLLENWKIFLGIEEGTGRSWLHVLLPSAHKPTGDGKVWRTFTSKCD